MDVLSSLLGGESLTEILGRTINEWLSGLVNEAFTAFDSLMGTLLQSVFHAENLVVSENATTLTAAGIAEAYQFIYLFACALITLKFLFKGFQVYILWRDGDADSSPRDMLMGSVQAAVVMVSFPYLYEILAEVSIYFAQGIMGTLGVTEEVGLSTIVGVVTTGGFLLVVVLLIYAIAVFVLWVKLVARGFELLVLRLGIPIACLGLIDSDMGLFKGYMQIFYKTAFTSIIQVTLMSLSFRVAGTFTLLGVLAALSIAMTAFATPALMQQLLITGRGGGGLSQKVYSASIAVRGVKSLLGGR